MSLLCDFLLYEASFLPNENRIPLATDRSRLQDELAANF